MSITYPFRLAAAVLLVVTMAACAAPDKGGPAPSKPMTAAKVPPPKKAVAKAKAGKAEKTPPPAPAAESQPEIVQEAAPVPTPTPPTGRVDIVGKSEGEVLALLGQPSGESATSPGKVLSFAGSGCAIEVHLFPDIKQGGFRALELISKGGDVAADLCAGRIRSERG